MDLSLHQLSIFESFIRAGGLENAAITLNLPQDEIATQIAQLEKAVGLPLYGIYEKKIRITEAGKEVLIYTESIDIPLRVLKGAISEIKNIQRGRLNIVIPDEANQFVPTLLSAFNRCYVSIDVYLHVTEHHDLLNQLKSGRAEIVILNHSADGLGAQIASSPMIYPWHCVYREDHPQSPVARAFCEFAASHAAQHHN